MSDAEILTYVNRARNEVQKLTMGLYPERFSRVWEIGIGVQDIEPLYDQTDTYAAVILPSPYVQVAVLSLPVDFIEMETVKIRYNLIERTEISEARRLTLYEFNQTNMHTFNYPTFASPIYTVERRGNDYMLYLSPSLSGTELEISQMVAEIWYIAAVMDMQNMAGSGIEDTDTQIPVEFQTLVLSFAELYILTRINPQYVPLVVRGEIERLTKMLKVHYQIETDLKYSLLPSKEA